MGVAEMIRIAELIDRALTHPDETTLAQVNGEVEEMTSIYPLYQVMSRPSRVRRTA
jgi:glycine/serine hydroxymethyltransferase